MDFFNANVESTGSTTFVVPEDNGLNPISDLTITLTDGFEGPWQMPAGCIDYTDPDTETRAWLCTKENVMRMVEAANLDLEDHRWRKSTNKWWIHDWQVDYFYGILWTRALPTTIKCKTWSGSSKWVRRAILPVSRKSLTVRMSKSYYMWMQLYVDRQVRGSDGGWWWREHTMVPRPTAIACCTWWVLVIIVILPSHSDISYSLLYFFYHCMRNTSIEWSS